MNNCPQCGRGLDDFETACTFCWAAMGDAPPDAADSTSETRHPQPLVEQASKAARATWTNWQVAGLASAALILLALVGTRASMQRSAGAQSTAVSPGPASGGAQLRESPALGRSRDADVTPKWMRIRQSGFASDGSRTLGFELEAENDVAVWMKRVRPVLAVRCLGGRMEIFVVTDFPASVESTPDRHTVQIGFDGQEQASQQWLDSADHRELFASDAPALASRIASAQTMHFRFTPFNAAPATVEFDVHGFAGPLDAVTKRCRAPNRGSVPKPAPSRSVARS